jgi:hypothetical protein
MPIQIGKIVERLRYHRWQANIRLFTCREAVHMHLSDRNAIFGNIQWLTPNLYWSISAL